MIIPVLILRGNGVRVLVSREKCVQRNSKRMPSAMMAMAEQMKQPPIGLISRSVPAIRPMPICMPGWLKSMRLRLSRPRAKMPVSIAPAGRFMSLRGPPNVHSARPQMDPNTMMVARYFDLFIFISPVFRQHVLHEMLWEDLRI